MKKIYPNLTELVKNNLNNPETIEAKELINELKDVKENGFLSKKQFYNVVMWKSPRPKKHYLSNSDEEIIKISREVLSSNSEDKIINFSQWSFDCCCILFINNNKSKRLWNN